MKRLRANGNERVRLEAIKYLGHWIGDLHQPLHVSFQDDRGGNDISTTGKCRGSLHSTWDGCIIKQQLISNPSKGTITRFARRARNKVTHTTRAQWTRTRLYQWADESFQQTLASDTDHCDHQGNRCAYDASASQITRPDNVKKQVAVDRAYLRKHRPIVRDRLVRAGVRLAYVLNTTL